MIRLDRGNWLGRYPLGAIVPLSVQTVTMARLPVVPLSAPVALIYSDTGRLIAVKIPADDQGNVDGRFRLPLFLNTEFALGRYRVFYTYAAGDYRGTAVDRFEIVGGGDTQGDVIALYELDRPEARYVVAQLSGGRICWGRNPQL